MTKTTSTPQRTQLSEWLGFFAAALYMQSVLTVAHHASMWAHDGSSHIVEPPSLILLAISLLLCGYSWHKKKRQFSTLIIISLTILATASLFWISGLRANFFF